MAHAARGRPVLEFGTRRGPAGGAAAGVRAALIGGAEYTSNVAVSQRLGLDPKGTHAHAMVQAFMARGDDELDAFRAYARVYPDECLLLVDTVDTLESGLPNAIKVFEELRAAGPRARRRPARLGGPGPSHGRRREAARERGLRGHLDRAFVGPRRAGDRPDRCCCRSCSGRRGLRSGRRYRQARVRSGHEAHHLSWITGTGRGLQAGGSSARWRMAACAEAVRHAGQDTRSGDQGGLAPLRRAGDGYRRRSGPPRRGAGGGRRRAPS